MSSNVPHFTNAMKKMKDYNLAAFKWFKDKPPCHWSRSHFSTVSKCDMLLNNICENFNKCILDAREKPILGLLEKIRVYLMVRMQQNMDKANKWEGKVCPKITKLLDKYKLDAANCIPTWLGAGKYEISCIHGDKYTVDLDTKTCSCGKWELSGIPCPHAISALVFNEVEPEDLVHEYYHVETFKKIYTPIVNPMNGPNTWPDSQHPPVLPPIVTPTPGRKKKNRIKKPDKTDRSQGKLGKKHQQSLRCGNCGTLGHNKRSCKTHTVNKEQDEPQPVPLGSQPREGTDEPQPVSMKG